jgi:hypothetical protein
LVLDGWRVGKNLPLIEANGVVNEMVKFAPELGRVVERGAGR